MFMEILVTIFGWAFAIMVTLSIIGLIIVGLSWAFSGFLDNFKKDPEAIMVEIVNEKPKERMKPSASQNIAESVTSGYKEHEGSTFFRSSGKGGYLPE